MASRRIWIGGSVLVALLGIGLVIYLLRRKTVVNVLGVVEVGTPTISFPSWNDPNVTSQESEMDRLIRVSNAAIAADDATEKL